MRSFNRIAALAAAAGLVLAAAAYASQPPVTVTAPAGITTISPRTLTHWVRIARHETPRETERYLQRQTLIFLIGDLWIRGEAGEQGIRVTSAQVRAELAREIREAFPKRRDFRRFLRDSGADAGERRAVRSRLVVRAGADALARFAREWRARWRARTVCAPAYTWDPDCSNYDGTPVDAQTRK